MALITLKFQQFLQQKYFHPFLLSKLNQEISQYPSHPNSIAQSSLKQPIQTVKPKNPNNKLNTYSLRTADDSFVKLMKLLQALSWREFVGICSVVS